jgi:hypothetical protein
MKTSKTKIFLGSLVFLIIAGVVGVNVFIKPKQAPEPRALSQLETEAVNSKNLELLNQKFDNNKTNLTLLDPINSPALTFDKSKLLLRNSSTNNLWFSDSSGVMAYQNVKGDFMVETKVSSNLRSDITKRSNATFSSAGLAIRDGLSNSGNMKWLVYNVGYQDGFFGTELKNTKPQSSDFNLEKLAGLSSQSNWYSNRLEGDSNTYNLRTCKVGPELRFYIQDPVSNKWIEELWKDTTVIAGAPSNPETSKGKPIRLNRPDLSNTLQVGVMTNDTSDGLTAEGRFEYVNYTNITDFNKCEI